MSTTDGVVDITILGAGPVGLSAAYYAGHRDASVRIVESLEQVGGQVSAVYPEKHVYDVAGHPRILGQRLTELCSEQGLQYGAEVVLGEEAKGLDRVEVGGEEVYALTTDKGRRYLSRAIVITAGHGAFEPRKLGIDTIDEWEGRGLHYFVREKEVFRERNCVIVGGGDSALDWAVNLQGVAESIMLIHRRDGFRAHAATINQVYELHRQGRCDFRTFWEVKKIEGDGRVERVTIFNNKTKEEETLELDAIIPLLGFHSDLGAIKEWGLDTEKADIRVNQLMETNVTGIYAAGDITAYPGKLKLIATGAAEACIAVNNAVHYINPKAKVNPGHSSNLAIFGQKDD